MVGLPGVSDIISTPGFWNKLASGNNDTPVEQRQENFLRGFIHEMKGAGASPSAVAGFMDGVSKLAGPVSTNYTVSPAGGLQVHQTGPIDSLWNSVGDATRGWRDKAKILFGSQDDSVHTRNINATAAEKSPWVSSVGKAIFSDPKEQAAFNVQLNNGNYVDALSMAGNHIGSSDMVKKWAPSVVPALTAVAAGRLSGLGWGGSLALGAGAGYIGQQAHNVGGVQNLMNDTFGTTFPGGPRPTPLPAAGAAATTSTPGAKGTTPNATPVTTPEDGTGAKQNPAAPGTATVAADKIKNENSAHADRINNTGGTQF